jgi:hypothetical protein
MHIKPKTLMLLLACAVFIVAGAVLLSASEKPQEARALEVALVGVKPQAIEVANAAGSYTVTSAAGGYEMPALSGGSLNEGMAEQLFHTLAGLKSQSAAPEGASGGYGLESPQATANITGEDGGSVTIKIGRKTAMETYYCESTAVSGVYLIEPFCAELLMTGMEAYQNRMLVDFVYDSDYEYLESLKISGKAAAAMTFENTPDGFALTEPIAWPCVQGELINQYFNNIMHLSGDTYAGGTQSPEMGFEDPAYVIELLYRGEPFSLIFGNELGTMRYVKRSDSDSVYLVSNEKLGFLRLDLRRAVGSALYSRPISEVASISVSTDTAELDFSVIRNGERYTTEINGKPASFMPMYNALLDMPPLNRISGQGGKSAIRIAITLSDGREEVLELAQLNEREYSVALNGVCEFSTYSANVRSVLESAEEILQSV